jgi:hypothetical protein
MACITPPDNPPICGGMYESGQRFVGTDRM